VDDGRAGGDVDDRCDPYNSGSRLLQVRDDWTRWRGAQTLLLPCIDPRSSTIATAFFYDSLPPFQVANMLLRIELDAELINEG
jgi:hypothetical protein